jgi:hypothetical protein
MVESEDPQGIGEAELRADEPVAVLRGGEFVGRGARIGDLGQRYRHDYSVGQTI